MMSLVDPAVQSYILYSGILVLKLFSLALLTGIQRFSKKVFANEEDAKLAKGKVRLDDPDVERVRRAHLNDLENIPAFWVVGALFLTTSPEAAWARLLFRVFTASRIVHTIVYAVKPMPQPSRVIAFALAMSVNVYMVFKVIVYYIGAF